MRGLSRSGRRSSSWQYARRLHPIALIPLAGLIAVGCWWSFDVGADPASPDAVAENASPDSGTKFSQTPKTEETGGASPAAEKLSVPEGNEAWSKAVTAARAAGLPEVPEPARDVLLEFVDTASTMQPESGEDSEAQAPDYSGISEGAALGELIGQFDEFQDNEWIQTGSPVVVAVLGYEDLEAESGPLKRLSICIDSSLVELKDQQGLILLPAAELGTRRSLNFYDLQERDGAWKVLSHSFPDDPAC